MGSAMQSFIDIRQPVPDEVMMQASADIGHCCVFNMDMVLYQRDVWVHCMQYSKKRSDMK
jgi:hypothetical protein